MRVPLAENRRLPLASPTSLGTSEEKAIAGPWPVFPGTSEQPGILSGGAHLPGGNPRVLKASPKFQVLGTFALLCVECLDDLKEKSLPHSGF